MLGSSFCTFIAVWNFFFVWLLDNTHVLQCTIIQWTSVDYLKPGCMCVKVILFTLDTLPPFLAPNKHPRCPPIPGTSLFSFEFSFDPSFLGLHVCTSLGYKVHLGDNAIYPYMYIHNCIYICVHKSLYILTPQNSPLPGCHLNRYQIGGFHTLISGKIYTT